MNKSGLRSPSTPSKTAPSTITNADNIQVVCRVRPLNSRELSENAPKCISVVHDSIKQGEKVFTYNQVFGELSKQQDVFNAVGNPVIDGVFQGFNGTIFAYGQTGSGKTHTMMGPDFDKSTSRELWGIIPRAIETIFNRISNSVDTECSVHVSFFEIYNEKVNDLLDIKNKNIDIRQANTEWEEVLSQKTVNGFQAAMHLLEQGVSHRKTGSTDMNAVSSRSHSIFVISLKQTDIIYKRSLLGKLYLVDLAGSEKQKKTNSTGERFKEGTNINKSLFVLSRVIHALTEGIFVPYRDAVLTKVLKNSLGGNCKTALVINVSPANSNEGETKSTLEFGSNAKKIKNDPRVNTTDDNQELSDLKGIIESQRVRIIDLTRQLELVSGGTDISFNASFSSMDLEGLGLSESFSQSSVVGTGICSTCGKELEEQEKQLKSKVTELSATIKALKEKVKKGESTVLVYQKRLKDQEKMDAESKKIKDQIEVHAYWKRKQVDLTDEIKKLELEIPKIVKQHSKVKSQYQEALNSLEADEDILTKLQEQFETTSAKVVTMKNEFHKMTDKQKELTSNSSRSECALKEKQELQTNAKAMIDKISKENERLSAQLATMEQDLTKYNEQYQVLSMSVQSQKKSNEMVEASLLELNHKRDELNKHSDDMQSEINGIAKDISDLEQHKRNLLAQIDSEKRVLGTLSSQLSEATSTISCQRGQLEELQQQEETIVNELGMLEAKLISLNDTKQRLTRERLQVEKSIPTLMEDLKEQNLQKKTLEEQLSIAQEEQSKLTEQTTKMRESIELTKRSEQEYNRILSNSESENATRKMEVEKIKQEIDSNNEQKKFFECQYGILKIQVDSLQQKISDMKFLKTQLEENSTSLNEDLTTLTNRFNTMESEKNHLLKNTAELKSKLKQLASDQSSCQHELAHTTRILEESQSTLSMNKEVLVATKQELQTVKQELERKKAQLNNLNGQVLSNSEQVQSIQQRNDTLRKSIEQLEVEHKDLAEKLRIERENIAREKQIHFEKLMEEEQQRREMERKRREEVFLQNSQERKLQDDRIATEINDYNSRLEVAIREMQQEMSNKMLQLSAQSQDFERRILAITRRKRDLNMEFQFQTRRDSTNSFSASSDDTNTNFDMSSISAAEVNATN